MYDPTGLFTTFAVTTPDAGPVAFGLESLTPEPIEKAVWRLPLPTEPRAAQHLLHTQLHRAEVAQSSLPTLTQKAEGLASRGRGAAQQPSFALGEAVSAEGEFLQAVGALTQAETPVSFGLEQALPAEWQTALEQLQPLLTKVQQAVAYQTYVETALGGYTVARTAILWSGDVHTVCQTNALTLQVALHERSLELAAASRFLLLRLFFLAARLAATLAIPGGPALAIPAAWRFLNRSLVELKQYQELLVKT